MRHWRDMRAIVATASRRWFEPQTSRMAAAMAFHALLALAPLLLLLLAVAGRLLGRETARESLLGAVQRFAGPDAERVAVGMLQLMTASRWRTTGTLLGVALLLLFTSTFFVELRSALNIVWETGHHGLRRLLLRRLLSLVETLMTVVLGLLILALGVLRSVVWPLLATDGSPTHWLLIGASHAATLSLTAAVLAIIYRYLPEVRPRPRMRAVLVGAVPTAVVLGVFSHLIGRIISASALASLYGAASSIIVALLWMYYSVWIALFGAELARAWDQATAGRAAPP